MEYDYDIDLISRRALKHAILEHEKNFFSVGFEDVIALINDAPRCETRPQGKWKLIQGSSVVFGCSCCNVRIVAMIPYDFCPNCGAKMKQD